MTSLSPPSLLGLISLTWLFAGCGAGEESAVAPTQPAHGDRRPNIVLIVADDLGYTDLGAFGGEIRTPHLDSLAMQGIRFTNFHTSASCAPTRAMLMTGTDNHLAGMGSQSGLETELQSARRAYRNELLPDVPTFVEQLRLAGYATYMTGKWHFGESAASGPHVRGFQRSFALLQGGASHFDNMPLFERYGEAKWREDGQPVDLPAAFYSTDDLTDRMIEYVAATPPGQPYLAYLAYTAPHWPLQAPADAIARYRGGYQQGWDALRAERMKGARSAGVVPKHAAAVDFEPGVVPWDSLGPDQQAAAQARMEVYAAMVDRLDQNVGRFVSHLQSRGDLNNTVIVFMSDNGAEAHDLESPLIHGRWLAGC